MHIHTHIYKNVCPAPRFARMWCLGVQLCPLTSAHPNCFPTASLGPRPFPARLNSDEPHPPTLGPPGTPNQMVKTNVRFTTGRPLARPQARLSAWTAKSPEGPHKGSPSAETNRKPKYISFSNCYPDPHWTLYRPLRDPPRAPKQHQ